MAPGMDLRELFEARAGWPTEELATRKIATFAVIPAAILGLLGSAAFVSIEWPIGWLAGVCSATAAVCGFGTAYTVLVIYRLFGFRPIAVLADALAGIFYGLLFGGAFTLFLMWQQLVPIRHSFWPLLLIPIGAVGFPLLRTWRDSIRTR